MNENINDSLMSADDLNELENLRSVTFKPIGFVKTPFKTRQDAPRQPIFADNAKGQILLKPELIPGLKDLDGFSHIFVLFHLHKADEVSLIARPKSGQEAHGVFASRSPARPNPIGLSVVKLVRIEDNIIYVENVDMLDGTPILDIKPFIETFNFTEGEVKAGWYKDHLVKPGKK